MRLGGYTLEVRWREDDEHRSSINGSTNAGEKREVVVENKREKEKNEQDVHVKSKMTSICQFICTYIIYKV